MEVGRGLNRGVCLTEVVGGQLVVFQSVLGTDCHNGLVGLEGLEALGLSILLPPGDLLFQNVEEGYDVLQAAFHHRKLDQAI